MTPQTFAASDLLVVGMLAVLEGLLSADNALVLALQVRHLSPAKQQKALSLGLIMAFVLRAIGILLAAVLIKLWWLCGLGALYLMFLAAKHFWSRHQEDEDDEKAIAAGKKNLTFGRTVALVGFTDVVFAVDSILVAVALVDTAKHPDKLWEVYLGGFLGVIALRPDRGGVFEAPEALPRPGPYGVRAGGLGGRQAGIHGGTPADSDVPRHAEVDLLAGLRRDRAGRSVARDAPRPQSERRRYAWIRMTIRPAANPLLAR